MRVQSGETEEREKQGGRRTLGRGGETPGAPGGPGAGWLAFEAGQKNGGRNGERWGGEGPRRTDPSERDRARTRARGTGVEAAQEVNVQGGNLFGVHGPLSTSKLAGSHPAQSASVARAKDRGEPCLDRLRSFASARVELDVQGRCRMHI